jgi:hypothetical protein
VTKHSEGVHPRGVRQQVTPRGKYFAIDALTIATASRMGHRNSIWYHTSRRTPVDASDDAGLYSYRSPSIRVDVCCTDE